MHPTSPDFSHTIQWEKMTHSLCYTKIAALASSMKHICIISFIGVLNYGFVTSLNSRVHWGFTTPLDSEIHELSIPTLFLLKLS